MKRSVDGYNHGSKGGFWLIANTLYLALRIACASSMTRGEKKSWVVLKNRRWFEPWF